MRHFGDITKIRGADVPPVDIICGGSPCQDLSVAGKRAGLAGERSGLFMDQIRVIKEMRENDRANGRADVDIRPRFMVWENVPGAFSSNDGEDFRAVLEETARVADSSASIPRLPKGTTWANSGAIVGDGWSIAWRVHDAQFWGVPQRRKRISLVADFAGGGALEILFERDGMQGDLEPGESPRENTARDAESGSRETGRALRSVCYGIGSFDSNAMKSGNPDSGIYEAETSRTLDPNGANPACNQGGIAVVAIEGNGARPSHKGDGFAESETMYTLNAVEQHAVAYRKQGHPQSADEGQGWEKTEVNDTLNAFDSSEARTPTLICYDASRRHDYQPFDDVGETVQAHYGTGGGNVPIVQEVWDARGKGDGKTVPSLVGDHQRRVTDLTAIVMHSDPREQGPAEAFGIDMYNQTQTSEQTMSITGAATDPHHVPCTYAQQSIVRRLTPLECERLQGYPDGWTDIGEWVDTQGKKHKAADAPRYKALGNSIALPFWQWMAERMVRVLGVEHPTMASLFDGIGGFPLVFSRVGCTPVWASEIEEFPIAVTKVRFPENENSD